MPTPWMPPVAGVSARTARTHSRTSSTVRGSAKSTFWMPAADGPHREVGARLLLDLHHRRHVREGLHRPREVLEREEVVGRVLAHELHVVEHAGVAGQLGHRRPDRVDMRAEGGLARAKPLAESVGTHAPSLGGQVRPVNHRAILARCATRPARSPASPLSDLPLSDLVVLDLTRVLAGPYCTRLLADLGARVVKIERPGEGDEMRESHLQLEPGRDDQTTYFIRINAGKESVALDLGHPQAPRGRARPRRVADVVVENFAPGVVEQLGLRLRGAGRGQARSRLLLDLRLRPDRPLARAPGLRPHHQCGLRDDAPRPGRPARAARVESPGRRRARGHARLRGHPGRALAARDRTGQGAYLDVSMLEALDRGATTSPTRRC